MVSALGNPAESAEAALVRLSETAAALSAAAALESAYAGWLSRAGEVAARANGLLRAVLDDAQTDAEAAGLVNVERAVRAGTSLCFEIARRASGPAMVEAMGWGRLHRRLYADVALTRREHAPGALLGLRRDLSLLTDAPVRILPGAEDAVRTLGDDWLTMGPTWDVVGLGEALGEYVVVVP